MKDITQAARKRITGEDRAKLQAELASRYTAGTTLRALVEQTGRSYGFVHELITAAGVTVRGRGGARKTPTS